MSGFIAETKEEFTVASLQIERAILQLVSLSKTGLESQEVTGMSPQLSSPHCFNMCLAPKPFTIASVESYSSDRGSHAHYLKLIKPSKPQRQDYRDNLMNYLVASEKSTRKVQRIAPRSYRSCE